MARRAYSYTVYYIRHDTLEDKVFHALKLHIQVALDYETVLTKLQSTASEKNMRAKLNNAVNSAAIRLRGVAAKRT